MTKTAQRDLLNLPKKDAFLLIDSLKQYEQEQKGYIKWLENRPGYRLKVGKYHIVFELATPDNKAIVLSIAANPPEH